MRSPEQGRRAAIRDAHAQLRRGHRLTACYAKLVTANGSMLRAAQARGRRHHLTVLRSAAHCHSTSARAPPFACPMPNHHDTQASSRLSTESTIAQIAARRSGPQPIEQVPTLARLKMGPKLRSSSVLIGHRLNPASGFRQSVSQKHFASGDARPRSMGPTSLSGNLQCRDGYCRGGSGENRHHCAAAAFFPVEPARPGDIRRGILRRLAQAPHR